MRFLRIAWITAWLISPVAAAEPGAVQPVRVVIAPELEASGWLETELTQTRAPNDHALVIRGKIKNPYAEPIAGIRMVVRLIARASDEERELEVLEVDLGSKIGPGKKATFSRELSTGYAKSFGEIRIVAFARTRGGRELIQPEAELIAKASSAQTIQVPTDIPYPNSPVGLGLTAP